MMRDTASKSFERLSKVYRNYVHEFKKFDNRDKTWYLVRTDVKNPDIIYYYKLPIKNLKGT